MPRPHSCRTDTPRPSMGTSLWQALFHTAEGRNIDDRHEYAGEHADVISFQTCSYGYKVDSDLNTKVGHQLCQWLLLVG